jgi:hypothetical protein
LACSLLGEPAKAEQLLTELENVCPIPCEEYDDLDQAIVGCKRLACALTFEPEPQKSRRDR